MGNGALPLRARRPTHSHSLTQIPGTKRVDHRRAVKMYERAAGDKTLPSDLRPPLILKASRSFHLFHPNSLFSLENTRLSLP